MDKRGVLIVVSGFSGSGKGTLMKELLNRYDNYALSVSATTRAPRPGEEEGREYFFKTTEEFEKMIAKDELIEYARYVDNYYGTPRAYVEEQLAAGKDVILEIEIQGALKIKKKFQDTLLLFVTPPTAGELRRRLVGRGTETMDVIEYRMSRAKNYVHLRNLIQDLLLIPLGQAAGYRQNLKASFLFIFCHLQNGLDTLFFGIMDKTAGIDHDNICLRLLVHDPIPLGIQKAKHHLRIHQVFVTPQ